ncbi:MAG: HYR domain-containing protein, partial [Fluviicola sp.]|nr:HYR domain-containing protein [Fluviicola sp.]
MKKKLLLILTVFILGIQFSGWSQCAPDVTKPTFTFCPGNQSVGTNSACDYIHANTSWDPIATDNCAGIVSYSYLVTNPGYGPPFQAPTTLNGFTFPKGTKWVTVTATDAAGNSSDPCFFIVTVSDDDAP